MKPLLTPEQVAERLALEVPQVYELIRARARDPLPAKKIGKYLRFDEDRFEEWLGRRSGGRGDAHTR